MEIIYELLRLLGMALIAFTVVLILRCDLYKASRWYARSTVIWGVAVCTLFPYLSSVNILKNPNYSYFLVIKLWSLVAAIFLILMFIYYPFKESKKIAKVRTVVLYGILFFNIFEGSVMELKFNYGYYNYINSIAGFMLLLGVVLSYKKLPYLTITQNEPLPYGNQLITPLIIPWILGYLTWNSSFKYSYSPEQAALMWTIITVITPLTCHLFTKINFIAHRGTLLLTQIMLWYGFGDYFIELGLINEGYLANKFETLIVNHTTRTVISICALFFATLAVYKLMKKEK